MLPCLCEWEKWGFQGREWRPGLDEAGDWAWGRGRKTIWVNSEKTHKVNGDQAILRGRTTPRLKRWSGKERMHCRADELMNGRCVDRLAIMQPRGSEEQQQQHTHTHWCKGEDRRHRGKQRETQGQDLDTNSESSFILFLLCHYPLGYISSPFPSLAPQYILHTGPLSPMASKPLPPFACATLNFQLKTG